MKPYLIFSLLGHLLLAALLLFLSPRELPSPFPEVPSVSFQLSSPGAPPVSSPSASSSRADQPSPPLEKSPLPKNALSTVRKERKPLPVKNPVPPLPPSSDIMETWEAQETSSPRVPSLLPPPLQEKLKPRLPDFSFDDLDPLAGLSQPEETDQEEGNSDIWTFSWENGEKRTILYIPTINKSEIPWETERLIDLTVTMEVAPDGTVISAEIEAPGTGNIKVDRYMYNLALSFVFAPRPLEEMVESGKLRLVFFDKELP